MENERYQKELFEFEQTKRQKPRFGGIFQRANFAITLTAEKIVFIIIGIIMLMVVFFALGVEKGKLLVTARRGAIQAQPTAPLGTTEQIKSAATQAIITTKAGAPVEPKKTQAQADVLNRPYTVVAAAFLRQDFASKEASRLKAGGFEAFVYYSEPYYLTCVGSFASKDSAQKILGKVKQMHRDAYVRLK
jgi:hypothetical protein